MGFRLPKTREMLRREAASWLARLQGGRDPHVERKFDRWYAEPRHAAAFDRVRSSYEQAGLLRHSATAGSDGNEPMIRGREWRTRPALAAAAAVIVLAPIGALLIRQVAMPFGRSEVLMLMTRVGEIRQVDLADGSRVTLDTTTRVDVEIRRSQRNAHLRYGRT